MIPARRILLIVALVLPSVAFAQQQQSPQQRTIVVQFLAPIDNNTVPALLHAITDRINAGANKVVILLSSPGGDTTSAFAAYSVLRHLPAEITTVNIGAVDSAGMLIYCAGKNRISVPNARFLIHGNSIIGTGNNVLPGAYNAAFLEAEVAQIKSLNQITAEVISATANKSAAQDIERAVQSQRILTPEEAKEWGLVQKITTDFMPPDAVMISSDLPGSVQASGPLSPYTSISSPTTK